jgi:glucokinase
MSIYVGLDIGGTKLMVAAGDSAGKIIKVTRRPTPVDLNEGLNLLDEMIREVLGEQPPAGIGAAIGGPLDWKTGVVSPLHQPQWRNVPLKSRMEAKWNCPMLVDVDTNIAAIGEHTIGKYTAPRFLYLTLSTGMGSGFLIDGEIYRGGIGGIHPEVGHQSIPFRCSHPQKIACACGAPDCLEALVSGDGIRRTYGKPPEELTDGEWEEVAWNLGQGLRNIAVMYAPDVIAIGGGIAHARGERLLEPARRVMQNHLKLVPPPQVCLSRLGYDTALRGSMVAARMSAE